MSERMIEWVVGLRNDNNVYFPFPKLHYTTS